MQKSSFFKLPLLFTLFYFLFSLIWFYSSHLLHGNGSLSSMESFIKFINSTLFIKLFYFIPEYLLALFVSSVLFYRANIHIISNKNITIVAMIALLSILAQFAYGYFVYGYFIKTLFELNLDLVSQFFQWFRVGSNILSYLLNILMIALLVNLMYGMFERSTTPFVFDATNNRTIYSILFILLFTSILTLVISPMLLELYYDIFHYDTYFFGDFYGICFLGLIISSLAVYFTVKSNFSYPFATLQVGRIIKITLLTLLCIFIINIIAGVIIFISYFLFWEVSILISIIIVLQIISSLAIARVVTKRYFSFRYNATMAERGYKLVGSTDNKME